MIQRISKITAAAVLFAALTCAPFQAWALWNFAGPIDTNWYNPGRSEFTLTTGAQMAGLSQLVENGVTFQGKTITLGNSIDLGNIEWEPIGSPYNGRDVFMGTFDGAGHEVTGLYINGHENGQALFGTVSNATIKNLTVRGSVTCSVDGAGIVARASSTTLENLTNYVNVEATGNFGKNQEKSYNGSAAGVVQTLTLMDNPGKTVYATNLVNYGTIRGTAPSGVAGVMGACNATNGNKLVLSKSFNYGEVYISMAQNVEGLGDGVGGVLGNTSQFGTYEVLNCGNSGDIFANNNASVGGVVGSIRGTNSVIDSSYNKGSIMNMGTDINAPTNDLPTAGGVVSQFESQGGRVSNNYSAGTISSSSGHSAAIVGASTMDMAQLAFNNYYLEGSSTGAFNDQFTGNASDSLLSGEALSAEELANKINPETGVVSAPDMNDYEFTSMDTVVEEKPELPKVDVQLAPEFGVLLGVLAVLLLAGGCVLEWVRFMRRRGSFEPMAGGVAHA